MLHCLRISRNPRVRGTVLALSGMLGNASAAAQPQPCASLPSALLQTPPPSPSDFVAWLSSRLVSAGQTAQRCGAPLDAIYYAGMAATIDPQGESSRRTFAELLASQGRADEAFLVQRQPRCLAPSVHSGQSRCDPTTQMAARSVVARIRDLQYAPTRYEGRYALTLWQTAAVVLDLPNAVRIQLEDASSQGLPVVELGLLLRLQHSAQQGDSSLRPDQWERLAHLRARFLLPNVTLSPEPPVQRPLHFNPLSLPEPVPQPEIALSPRPPATQPPAITLRPAILTFGVGTSMEWRRMQLYTSFGDGSSSLAVCQDFPTPAGPPSQGSTCPRRDSPPRPYAVINADLFPFARLHRDWLRGIGASLRGGLALTHPPAGTPDDSPIDSLLTLLAYRVDAMAIWGYEYGFTSRPTGPRLMMRLHLHYAHRYVPRQPLVPQTQRSSAIRDFTLPSLTYKQWAWGGGFYFYVFQIRKIELGTRVLFSYNIAQSSNYDINSDDSGSEMKQNYTGFSRIRSQRGLQVEAMPIDLRIGRRIAFSFYVSYEEHQLTFDNQPTSPSTATDTSADIMNNITSMDDVYINIGARLSWVL